MSLCHFLIGVPGSGKSTFATELAKLGNYIIISTDEIRSSLYGDAATQGAWNEVETEAISQIYTALKSGKGVIYDATNFKRPFRMEFLQKVKKKADASLSPSSPSFTTTWIAWYLKTPIETCIAWNQKRVRQVPQDVIKSMFKSLQNFPPLPAEGFAVVEEIDVTSSKLSLEQIQKRVSQLHRRITNSNNRTKHDGITFHSYSKLLDFDRLMHLISLIIQYPGIGNLHSTNPSLLEKIFDCVPEFTSNYEEITAIVAKLRGHIYASKEAITADLQWLEENGVIGSYEKSKVKIQKSKELCTSNFLPLTSTHPYSDAEPFERLIGTIRFILHHPFSPNISERERLKTLLSELQKAGVIIGNGLSSLRKDIEKVLKPYKILPNFSMRNGYFAGTGILSKQELIKVFKILQSQAKSLDDPLALDFYEQFKQRMLQTKLISADDKIYPVRSIANHSIINNEYLHETALAKNVSQLEEAIASCALLELNRFVGGGKYTGDEDSFFLAYPLQIVFYNLAWYLGYECISGDEPGLLRFERLDRLFFGKLQNQFRSRQEQEKSLRRLQALLKASAGLFLGYSAADQRKFLSQDKRVRSQVCVTVELWFNDTIYRFIVEGTKRFAQMKMTRPASGVRMNFLETIFCLKKTGDKQFPNRFQVILPKWCLNDFDLWRWIIGFGGNVKVVEPSELVERVREIGRDIVEVYDNAKT